ncbi:hypothetical protein BJ875DRAFT_464995 [Amylocarpus encephaloides]|uniref:Uncharacterized protein n=1 Tax=Amylocarpus encephaloides TaxID=45428 RepID=A0A9P8C411_9HELO|nr:hypothetical protein BJ875DRAFT_464995 [Amylocarpus encephaloides]
MQFTTVFVAMLTAISSVAAAPGSTLAELSEFGTLAQCKPFGSSGEYACFVSGSKYSIYVCDVSGTYVKVADCGGECKYINNIPYCV